jgi:tetratricopeptide (TPR) repeat protein
MGARVGFVLIVAAIAAGLALLFTAPPTPAPDPGAAAASAAQRVDGTRPEGRRSNRDRIDVEVIRLGPGDVPAASRGGNPATDAAILGWQALQTGDDAAAIRHFNAAVEKGAKDVSLGLAVAYRNLDRPAEALLMARQAVVERADEPDPWRLLGQLLYDDNDLEGAVEAWDRAQALEPDPNLTKLLERARADVETRAAYLVGESRHFRVRFEGPQEGYLAQQILSDLENAYASVGLALGYYPDTVVETVLYTEQAFFDVTQSPQWAGGIFDGTVRLPVAGAPPPREELRRIVTHEYTHAAMALLLGSAKVPTWLHEGVAMNLEGSDHTHWVDMAHSGRTPLSAARLTGPFLGLSKVQADTAYAESYLLVRSLVERFGQFRLADLLEATRDLPFEDAFRDVYGETPSAALDRALSDAGWTG